MILGDTEKLQIRADVDEQNAPLVVANQPAVAFLKGDTLSPIPLRFVRIEPFVVPKRSLTGEQHRASGHAGFADHFQFDRPQPRCMWGSKWMCSSNDPKTGRRWRRLKNF